MGKMIVGISLLSLMQFGCDAQDKSPDGQAVEGLSTSKTTTVTKSELPAQYDLSKPTVIELPDEIDEISGMEYNSEEHSIYAIDDNEGELFKIRIEGNEAKVQKLPFAKAKDYEGIAIVDHTVYVLNSPGSIQYFRDEEPIRDVRQVKSPAKGKNEFEILYKDPKANRLMMVCKDCADDKKSALSVWGFDLEKKAFSEAPVKTIDVKKLENATETKIGRFKPSAANVHPVTGDVYIISSIDKVMVVTDPDFNIKTIYKLHRDHFKQPEGLCFTPDGKLLISNEAAGKGKANILIYDPQ